MNLRPIRLAAIKGLTLVKKYLPLALAVISTGTAVTATVLAIKEAEDASKHEEPSTDEKTEVTKTQKAIEFVKKYRKPLIFCAVSVASGGLSTYIFCRRQKRLTIANEQMESLLQKYIHAATATMGVEGTKFINKYQEQSDIPEVSPDEDGLTLFWDPIFNYWFRAGEIDLIRAAKDISHQFSCYGEATLESFYTYMGVDPPTDEKGQPYLGWGWFMDDEWVEGWCEYSGYVDIDCSPEQTTDDGLIYKRVMYFQEPKYYNDMDYWG